MLLVVPMMNVKMKKYDENFCAIRRISRELDAEDMKLFGKILFSFLIGLI
jgi:hypothetical protein